MKVLSVAAMRRWEEELISGGTAAEELMFNAGRNIAGVIRDRLLSCWQKRKLRQIVVVCGGGNNGGDGVVIAMELAKEFPVQCILTTPPADMAPVARHFAKQFASAICREYPDGDEFPPNTLIVDAITGIGMHGPLRGKALAWAEAVNASGCVTVAVDVPAGVDSEGVNNFTVRADLTVAAGAFKPCHFSSSAVGELEVVAITDKCQEPPEDCNSEFEAVTACDAASCFSARKINGHKNLSGRVAVVAGSRKFGGAALLAAAGAQAGGAGMIRLITPAEALIGRWVPPEIILAAVDGDHLGIRDANEIFAAAAVSDVLLFGPGVGTACESAELAEKVYRECPVPVVADADALNLLAGNPHWTCERQSPLILTPHPGEALRLAPETGELSRKEQALFIARKYNAVVILKGYQSVIASPDGRLAVNTSGGPVLSVAGSGDVLAGFLAALLCGNDPYTAAKCAAWYHGRITACADLGRGTTAGDLPELLKKVCAENSWRY